MSTLAKYHDWAAGRSAPRLTDWLREISEPDWSAVVNHPLFDALAEGSLPGEEFADYMVQDYGFVDPFTALLGHAIGHAPGMADRVVLGQFLGMLTSDEDSVFQRTFETFGVPDATRHAPTYLPATASFLHLLRETGASASYAQMLAVLVVTEWLYLGWAMRITRGKSLDPLYDEWIGLHDNQAFQAFVAWLRRRLDEVAETLDEAEFARMTERFRETVAQERAFHDAVYSG
ncbi:TenA family protein [Halomonas sp. TRM85114]|uniref:TenA family protein n=1 Tax=Halomonas jincaotanensis TaxID=2810616 RepID=UPI001BD27235|nr:TenA family protein [Halomonas jincaotanensis]MBS9402654.1 TenA family protein [Halomonas jincaotanensis]